jgi:hypothetical protein
MSKVVKSVGKVVKGVGRAVKKVAKSKIGKVLIGAAAMYFGVPMISGALSGAAAGAAAGKGIMGTIGGALSGAASGAAAGISQAWAGITGAIGSGSLGGAAKSLAGGMSPSAAWGAGAQSVGGAVGSAAGSLMPNGLPLNPSSGQVTDYLMSQGGSTAPGGGLISNIANSSIWNSRASPALINVAGNMIGGIGQGVAQKSAMDRQEQLKDEDLQRYNTNLGGNFRFG